MRRIDTFAVLAALALLATAGCAGHAGGAASLPLAPAAPLQVRERPAEVPSNYRCLPAIPAQRSAIGPSLAYTQNCAVATAKEAVRLQELAVALIGRSAQGTFVEYCTGTPLAYDASTKVGFVSTAAHCVIGGTKAAGAKVTPANIVAFSNRYWVYQGTPGKNVAYGSMTGQIVAAYVPSQYCQTPSISGSCRSLSMQNGDVAILKIQAGTGAELRVNPDLRLAPSTLQIPFDAEIMALGYGLNTTATPDDRVLNYVTYRYYATNTYAGAYGELSIFNGYRQNGSYFAILCQGDSGGGDFVWNGSGWDLIGVHSFGNIPCGTRSTEYRGAIAASADARPWESWIQEILTHDTSPTGCASLNPADRYVCRSR